MNTFFYILSTVPFKVVPSTGDTPFPTFLPLLERFLERTFCDGAQFSYRIFLNLRVLKKKRTNFFNSAPTSIEGALRLLSANGGGFWQQTAISPVSLWALVAQLHPLFKKFGLFLNTGVNSATATSCRYLFVYCYLFHHVMINSLTPGIRTYVHTTLMTGTNSRKRSSGYDINSWITLYISLAQFNILNIKHLPL